MEITIREANHDSIRHLKKGSSSFEVKSKLVPHAENGRISYTFVDVPHHTKQYGMEEFDADSYVGHPDRVVFFACLEDKPIGQIRLQTYWNGYAYIDDIAVDVEYRGEGIGRTLMQRAIDWAKEKEFPGIMLETQDNNVAGCRLYARCGFELRGFDTHLYKGIDPSSDEIALYWYLIF
jgi:ribosomal protein S18 acetylase RimI-like enzyme